MKSLLKSKTILGIVASLILVSCDDNHTEEPISVSFDIRLPQDKNGYFHFISRKDYQIKNMGYRIELEEIESDKALCLKPGLIIDLPGINL